ncbi:MAG TPA: SulP family inorganic anion transporter, partial [Chroococcales cyanobacterium]
LVGLLQLVLTWLKWARFSYLIPSAAIQGMLASIGFMLMAKQIPNFIGHKYMAHEFFPIIVETPSEIGNLDWSVFLLSSICLTLLFLLPKLKAQFLKFMPPQLVVVIVGVILGRLLHLDTRFLVHVPDNPLEHGIVPPDFRLLFADPSAWKVVASAVILLCFVDGTESLATIHAVDRLDPFHRRSNPDRTLAAMGVSNICSSLIGGITIIPGIIKSTTCIVSGGRTAWVNFYNALFLIFFILAAKDQINMIPIGALAAVLAHIGYKLAGLHKWRFIKSLGIEQMAVFVTTILVTLNSDLLIGIFAGMLVKIGILIYFNVRGSEKEAGLLASLRDIFASPIEKVEQSNSVMNVYLKGPVNCFNSLKLRGVLDKIPAEVSVINVYITRAVTLVDHSVSSYFYTLSDDCRRAGQTLSVIGLEALRSQTRHASSLKYKAKLVG